VGWRCYRAKGGQLGRRASSRARPAWDIRSAVARRAVWRVKDKLFAWERPLRRADYNALGDAAPDGPILGARVADEGVKEALLADQPDVYFTTPHFNGYPAVLVRLEQITVADLEEVVIEAWLDRAPRRIAEQHLSQRPERS
jgi:hypothetical protein